MKRILEQIIDKYTEGNYLLNNSDKAKMVDEILNLSAVIGRLSFKEIEMLVQLKHYDDSDYGNDGKRCAELIEATRNKVGYTKEDVKYFKKLSMYDENIETTAANSTPLLGIIKTKN